MWTLIQSLKAVRKFPGYKPQQITFGRARRWIKQFEKRDRRDVTGLLDRIIYLTEHETQSILVAQNAALMAQLATSGLRPEQLIYVQVHDAGSSSPVMLNMLRDAAGLERLGCRFVDARDLMGLNRETNEVGEGALIYVDDFLGTGNQFCGARDFAMNNVVGTFSEFLIVPCICEEGYDKLAERDIVAFAGHVHSIAERPLHENSNLLSTEVKLRLRSLSEKIDPPMGLGYKGLATMVVLYRNAPNTIPALLRGCRDQSPHVGIFPRTDDLPVPRK